MKSVPALPYVLLLTVVIIALTPFHQNSIMHLCSLLFVSVMWGFIFYKAQSDLNNHNMVVDRVDQLKTFSIQLQSLINKELALVQEDVDRTRTIVSDSINILQNSSSDISNNMLSQQQYLQELLAALESTQALSVANANNMTASSTTVNVGGKEFDAQYFNSIEGINKNTKDSIDNMLVALQFEDIVGQISERVVQHIGDIRSTVDILSKLCESEFSATFEEDIDKMQLEYTSIKDKLSRVSSKNLAAQKNMDEGDIELF